MKSCNAEAGSKALKGDERKKFMSDCPERQAGCSGGAGGTRHATGQNEIVQRRG